MPTTLREKGYKFYFVMFDLNEPLHVHVDKQDGQILVIAGARIA